MMNTCRILVIILAFTYFDQPWKCDATDNDYDYVNAQLDGGISDLRGSDNILFMHSKEDVHQLAEQVVRHARQMEYMPQLDQTSLVPHRPDQNAVFAMAFKYSLHQFEHFVLGCRRHFTGDIVLGVSADISLETEAFLNDKSVVYYKLALNCVDGDSNRCRLYGADPRTPSTPSALIRFDLYEYWASMYSPDSWILLTDFRDVVWQGNVFDYKPYEWQQYDLILFLEFIPNKIIQQCPFNSGWIRGCYGDDILNSIGMNPVSCSGTTMGTRDGILIYAYMMAEEGKRKGCTEGGIDQGIHNKLYYTGHLSAHMNVRSFHQGYGPVNTIGAMHPTNRHHFKGSLRKYWKILDDEGVHNYNGDISPLVHQGDRFGDEYGSRI